MSQSRIEEARRRAAGAKRIAVAAALAGFLGLVVVVRSAHPGNAATSSGSAGSSKSSTQSSDDGNFDFGSSSVAPSSSAPQTQTGVS